MYGSLNIPIFINIELIGPPSENNAKNNIANAANADASTVNEAVNQLKTQNDANAMNENNNGLETILESVKGEDLKSYNN